MITAALSRLGPGTLAGALVRLPLRLLPRGQVMTVRSGLNKGMRWIAGAGVHGCWLGHYENEKQQALERLVRPGMRAYDIGANAGFYTLAFARLVGHGGHVWAFEPLPENAANLLRHIELNGLSNATLVQAAISDKSGIASFQAGANNSAGKLATGASTHAVPTSSLDELVRVHGLPPPDLVKMDVEGAEAAVLKGATALLERGTTSFLVALHGDALMRECLEILERYGYQARSLGGTPVTSTSPFVDEIVAEAPKR